MYECVCVCAYLLHFLCSEEPSHMTVAWLPAEQVVYFVTVYSV